MTQEKLYACQCNADMKRMDGRYMGSDKNGHLIIIIKGGF